MHVCVGVHAHTGSSQAKRDTDGIMKDGGFCFSQVLRFSMLLALVSLDQNKKRKRKVIYIYFKCSKNKERMPESF